LFYFIVYSFFFQSNKDDLISVFSKYIRICNLISILGLIQFIIYFTTQYNVFSFITKISQFEGTSISRISSITTEPSNLAVLLTPAIGYYLFSDKTLRKTFINYRKRYFFIVLIVGMLTFSSIFYFSLFLMLLFKITVLRKNKLVRFVSTVMIFFLVAFTLINYSKKNDYNEYGVFKNTIAKITQTFESINNLDYRYLERLNGSSFATLVNLSVAVKSPNRITGSGLGTHEQNYQSIYPSTSGYVGKNMKDAYSLGIRVFSEFGFFGLILLFLFFLKNYNKYSLINISVLFLLISLCIRGGNYVLYGVVFFFFFYYYTRLKTISNN
jgi:hypothetical protein